MSADSERIEAQPQQQQTKIASATNENCLLTNSTKGPAPKAPTDGKSALNGKHCLKKNSLLPLFHEVINEPGSSYAIRNVRIAAEQVIKTTMNTLVAPVFDAMGRCLSHTTSSTIYRSQDNSTCSYQRQQTSDCKMGSPYNAADPNIV